METAPVEIVTLSPDEWQAYRDLRLEMLQESPQAFGTTYQAQSVKPDSFWQTRLESAAKGEQNWLIFARADQQLVGMMGAFRGSRDFPDASDRATIIAVYVTPAWRGKGVSYLLMRAILDTLKENGIRVVHLGVTVEQIAAVHLYQRFGFTIVNTEYELMGDNAFHDGYLMEKVL
jgi:ribosomal protein S18 acetylase RimI-like enzyme